MRHRQPGVQRERRGGLKQTEGEVKGTAGGEVLAAGAQYWRVTPLCLYLAVLLWLGEEH